MGRVSLSDEVKSIKEILDWYEEQLEALRNLRNTIITNATLSLNIGKRNWAKFENFSIDEINEYFSSSERELEHLTCFDLISTTEGLLKIDYLEKCYRKEKSSISIKLREIYQRNQERASLEAEILQIWKKQTGKKCFSDFIGLLKYRHWLAHGRYWTPKFGRKYTFSLTYDIVKKVSNELDNYQ